MEIIGIVVIVLISMLAAASGIGGGQILVPLSIILLQFEAKQAIALSNGIILCNGLVKTIVGICRKHPTIKSKTLIDYNIVILLMPTILLGSFIGAILGEMMPNQLQLTLLATIMIYTIFKSGKSARERWMKESKEIKAKKQGKYEKAEEPENVEGAKEIEESQDEIPEVPITKMEDIPLDVNGKIKEQTKLSDDELPAIKQDI